MDLGYILLCLVGLINASYFTLLFYGWVKEPKQLSGLLCRAKKSDCLGVIFTPYSRIFGLPNSVLGIGFYVGVIGAFPFLKDGGFLSVALLFAGGLALLVGTYLIYVLRVRLHMSCQLCYLAHGVNTAILVLMVLIIS